MTMADHSFWNMLTLVVGLEMEPVLVLSPRLKLLPLVVREDLDHEACGLITRAEAVDMRVAISVDSHLLVHFT